MIIKDFEPSAAYLFRYVVASADMYYAEEEQRDIFVGRDENGHLCVWGQPANGTSSTKISLCQVFLEYGLYCSSWCNTAEAYYHMQNFGERLGHWLAQYLQNDPELVISDNLPIRALELILTAMGADFSKQYIEGGVHFLITRCPVVITAKRSGIVHVELARHGVNAMCRSLLLDMNPHLIVDTSPENCAELIFTIRTAEASG